MDFKLSYNWLKELSATKSTPVALASRMSLYSATAEKAIDLSAAWENICVGEIKKISLHPNADKLRLVETSIGKKTVTIVCGGSNLTEGQLVVVALPGAKVRWHGEGELITITPTTIRGIESFGMICGASEVGLSEMFPPTDSHEIVDISSLGVKAGTPLAKALGYDDTSLEFEVTSNRPDMMCAEGIARELCAIEGKKFEARGPIRIQEGDDVLSVVVKEAGPCPRYQAVKMSGIQMKQSPIWMQSRLRVAGIRPINVIVDIGNYVMLEMGQPMHAFDGDKVAEIVVRCAKKGEKMTALDGKDYTLDSKMLVIADAKKPIAIAGVMGATHSGISDTTKNIIWEAAAFDPVSIRKTARGLLIFSESAMRFEKGLSSVQTFRALARAVELTLELAGGHVSSKIVDVKETSYTPRTLMVDPKDFERIIGVAIDLQWAKAMLSYLGFKISGESVWEVEVPHFRDHDVGEARDIVEEVARMNGYHSLPPTVPSGISNATEPAVFSLTQKLQNLLTGNGFYETMSVSMVSADLLLKVGQKSEDCVAIQNPLTNDWVYMRTQLIPSMIAAVAGNISHTPNGRLFEIANVYLPTKELSNEEMHVVATMWAPKDSQNLFFDMKGTLDLLFREIGIAVDYNHESKIAFFHPGRTAHLVHDKELFGIMGEVHPAVLSKFGIEGRVVVAEFSLSTLSKFPPRSLSYTSLPEFPGVKRDIAFFIDARTPYQELHNSVIAAHTLVTSVEVFDVYEGKGVPEGMKSIALHIEYRSPEKTLSMEDAESAHAVVSKKLESDFNAQVRN